MRRRGRRHDPAGSRQFRPAPHSVELREIPIPRIGPDDVLLEVAVVGVCGSDLHQWTAEHSWPVNYPVVLGHEFAGVVREIGDRVQGWREGDRSVSETAAVIDLESPLTKQGLYNLDPTRSGFGYGVDGAMTRLVRVPARCLHHLPDSLAFEKAGLTEPCCVAYNAVAMQSPIRPGDRVVVFGPGPIGILSAAMARLQGAEVAVVGLSRDTRRLAVAKQYGCVPLVDGLLDWARAGDGLGVDGVIDAAGVSATMQTAHGDRAPRGLDHQGRLGKTAARVFARSARAKEYHAPRQFQPQLADLGASDPPVGQRFARCGTDHWRNLAAGRMADGV